MPAAKKRTAAKKTTRKKKKAGQKFTAPLTYELTGIVLITLSIMSIFQYGMVGNWLTIAFTYLLGNFQLIIPVSIIILGVYLMIYRKTPPVLHKRLTGALLILLSIFLFSHVLMFDQRAADGLLTSRSALIQTHEVLTSDFTMNPGAGMFGALLYSVFHLLFASAGSKVAAIAMFMIGAIMLSGKSVGEVVKMAMRWVYDQINEMKNQAGEQWKERKEEKKKQRKEEQIARRSGKKPDEPPKVEDPLDQQDEERSFEPLISSFAEKASIRAVPEKKPEPVKKPEPKAEAVDELEEQDFDVVSGGVAAVENKEYVLPSIDLLSLPPHADQSSEYKAIQKNASKLEKTFQSFGVRAKVTQVHLGPAVTKYEVHPDTGVKVSKIVNLSDDLALALAAKDIRIEAPIPGKSAIGIEVPNSEVAMVSLREVLEAQKKEKENAKLLIGLGRDITGEAVAAELNKMPHLLVAGATGSGKSVCINGIIVSILMRTKPHEVKLMMIDPKMVELNVYNGVPHLLAPVVTDARKASQALKKVVSEMERRYDLFSHTGTRNIEGYNEHIRKHNDSQDAKQPQLPYIVVIVDELADLMMVASNDVEDSITRLAQMARAAGIHLIIATQRPSVDVITGVIKANIPSRIAFAVSSQIDSRTILDTGGAEKLLGRGDMLFMPIGANKPVRVQGAFLSDEEVETVVNAVIEQQKAQYQEEMIPDEVEETSTADIEDDLFDEAVDLVVEMQTASVSMLQRRFRVGYTRAARLIDAMEQRGIVGPYEGSKPRTVLKSKQAEEHH
ncbi:DNA translocase FtsK [Jeotgalibacillus sp. R-1-5s-1]|uniref:FtsK/SpoIIIE family DNA translocase n=1 Tax=Jeotgalibacillus sp. R-1-5s-1 TaxID=2555897 RepID=UPI00106CF7C4|nr:DNA translocase FtsK [Jeotgalibacillus sp. R-1-5s-1]TFE03443.1 DNA translocase FtsK [Jeotgalibacillus sp. R-1-5s-1]